MSEVLLRGGTVIDGTGAPRFQADVLMAGGKIKAVGKKLGTSGEIVDVTGLAVLPGIIDAHTHMDGQFFLDRRGTPSSWHGVTTVLMGHCGYSLAPVKAEHRDYIIHLFARVEEIPPHIFEKYLPWDWENFGEYADSLDRGLGMNAIPQVGHSTLRYYVMGAEAAQRSATEDEIQRMRSILHESLESGAFGFTTSRSSMQVAWDGGPVPSRYAAPDEVVALAATLRDFKAGTLGLNGLSAGTDEDDRFVMAMMERSGKSLQVNRGSSREAIEFMREAWGKGLLVYSVTQAQPFLRYFTLFEGTTAFNSMDTWWKMMMEANPEERIGMLADPALRPQLRREVDAEVTMDARRIRRPALMWGETRVARAKTPANRRYEGLSIKEIAGREGKHLVDAMLDIAAAEGFKTQFSYRKMSEEAWLQKDNGIPLANPTCLPMSTDAGAHLANECKAGESTYFLKEWVLKVGLMTLEEGVRKVTSLPARFIGIPDRGMIREGMAADIAVFDLEKLHALPKEQADDLPGGETRWIQRAGGVEHVWVNGEPTIQRGRETGNLPGKLVRSSWYR